MIQVNAQLTLQDYLHYSYDYFFRRPITKIYLGLFIPIVCWQVYKISVDYDSGIDLVWLALPGIFLLSLVLIYVQAKSVFKTSKAHHEPIAYTFTEDFIFIKSESLQSELKWDTFIKVAETNKLFILNTTAKSALLIPKASFETTNKMEALRVLIRSKPELKHKLKTSA